MRTWMANAREKKNLTQQQLAELVDVTRQAISAIENGERFPRPALAKRISEELGEPISKFYEHEEPPRAV